MGEKVKLFNRSTVPLVPADVGWGNGVVMPGGSFETGKPESYAPNHPTSAWRHDREAEAALAALGAPVSPDAAPAGDSSGSVTDGHSEPQDASQAPSGQDGPAVHIEPSGDVVTDAGQIVGHVESNGPPTEAAGGNA